MMAMDAAVADWPAYGLADSVLPFLSRAKERNEPVALATLFRADGGGPRGVGAQMAITRQDVSGYLSGGCVEADVTKHALACLEDGNPRTLVYGQGGPIDVRLPCGGRIDLLVEHVGPNDPALAALLELTRAREASVWTSDGRSRQCRALNVTDGTPPEAGFDEASGAIFRITEPQARLVVVGHDPNSLAIAALGHASGYDVTLVRPKGPSTPPPIVGIRYLPQTAGEAFSTLNLDRWTSVVIATHDEEEDHAFLRAALPSPAGYVGLLGSRRRLPAKISALRAAGLTDVDIERLKAPVGLNIGARTPWEIATSVVGQVIQEARLTSRLARRASAAA